jgi:hypothetical protein
VETYHFINRISDEANIVTILHTTSLLSSSSLSHLHPQ